MSNKNNNVSPTHKQRQNSRYILPKMQSQKQTQTEVQDL